LYIDETTAGVRTAVGTPRVVRLAVAAWAAAVYLLYWLGYLGLR
jgi:hypothetical protein